MAVVNIRDIPLQIEIQDSCNCRCCLPFWKHRTPAYITKNYSAEEFSPRKSSNPQKDRLKSIERLQTLLSILHEHQLIRMPIKVEVNPEQLTFREIERINRQIREIMRMQ